MQIQHNQDDTVQYGSGWNVSDPQFVSNNFVHRITQGSTTVHVLNTRPYTNLINPTDVKHDRGVSPLGALTIINLLNSGVSALPAPTASTKLTSFAYVDVNPSGDLTALDVLLVINVLNGRSGGSGEQASENEQVGENHWIAYRDSFMSQDDPQDELKRRRRAVSREEIDTFFMNYDDDLL